MPDEALESRPECIPPPGALDVQPLWVTAAGALLRRLPRGRFRLMGHLPHRDRPFVGRLSRTFGGGRFECHLRDEISREVCFLGRYEPLESALTARILRPGATFVDVGANWGYYTLLAAASVGPGGRVIALEPDPRLYPLLTSNGARNGYGQVTAIQAAAADCDGCLVLEGFRSDEGNWGLSRVVSEGEPRQVLGEGSIPVRARALDSLLDELGHRRVDLVKMDIEGAEHTALRGMQEGLNGVRYRAVLLELHPTRYAPLGLALEDVVMPLIKAGYSPWSIPGDPTSRRRAAYGHIPSVPLRARLPASDDPWPHVLWLAPGVSPPEGWT